MEAPSIFLTLSELTHFERQTSYSIQIIWAIFGAILWPIFYVGSTVLEAVYPYQFNYWAIF